VIIWCSGIYICCAISDFHHKSCEFYPTPTQPWWFALNESLCNKVCELLNTSMKKWPHKRGVLSSGRQFSSTCILLSQCIWILSFVVSKCLIRGGQLDPNLSVDHMTVVRIFNWNVAKKYEYVKDDILSE